MSPFHIRLLATLAVVMGATIGAQAQQPAGKAPAPSSAPRVVLATSAGDITLELEPHEPRRQNGIRVWGVSQRNVEPRPSRLGQSVFC